LILKEENVSAWSKGQIAKICGVIVAGGAALILGALLVAWSGVSDIAASQGHYAFVERFLEFGMRNAVATHARGIEAPQLENPNLIRLGAGHFHRGCAFCHGAPGIPVNPIAKHMLPSPPDLAVSMRPWKERELFWIVKHGFKYTGMPGWVALERDDEIWAVVAFLKLLPTLDANGYRDLALGNIRVSEQSGSQLATAESNPEAVGACGRCHGGEGERPMSNLVPVLHGQPAGYLFSALKNYAEGKRRSGIMQPLAADLRDEDMRNLANYYARMTLPAAKPKVADAALIESGRKLAVEGVPNVGVPPCLMCHGRDAPETYPRLAGQHAAFMAGQLRLWKMGIVPATELAAVMSPIVQQLSDRQIDAVTTYFAGQMPEPREIVATAEDTSKHPQASAQPIQPVSRDSAADAGKTPKAVAESTAKGELKSPHPDVATAAEEGHKKYMAAGCNGCHGGGGGGGMGPPLTNEIWVYGSDDDTLFRVIALGSDPLLKQGYSRKGSENVVGPMPPMGEVVRTEADMWAIIAWIRSVNPIKDQVRRP
jgi:cytochrome c553